MIKYRFMKVLKYNIIMHLNHFLKESDWVLCIELTILSRRECCREKLNIFYRSLGKYEAIKGERL